MKRRVISLITALALCLSLCPTWALAADSGPDTGLCPHHGVHTEECGYAPPAPGRECAHEHDESCYTAETLCVHRHTEECRPELEPDSEPGETEPPLCTHECSEDSGCITLTPDCPHVHDGACGYVPADTGAPCTFVCQLCPIEDLIDKLPLSVTPDNKGQVEDQLGAVLALYAGLTDDEQDQLDLSRCFDLLTQLDAASTPMLLADDEIPDVGQDTTYALNEDETYTNPFDITIATLFHTGKYTFTASKSTALRVQKGGKLYLMGSRVISKNGIGVEVLTGGFLRVDDPGLAVEGTTYGLTVASGADVKLSGGTFTGGKAAVQAADGNPGALLESGYAYFGTDGNPIPLADVAAAKTVVIKACTAHLYSYTPDTGSPTHSWTCAACGMSGTSEACTFNFKDGETEAKCVCCDHMLSIAVDETNLGDLIYDSQDQKADVTLTVKLEDGTVLTEDADYAVAYTTRSDVGEITVTVTGSTYSGTFIKTYTINQDEPGIKWDGETCNVPYDGSEVEIGDLPHIIINIKASSDADLRKQLQYSYRKESAGDAEFTDGLPTTAGVYYIKASLPEQQNYKAAETDPCLKLTIEKIPALVTEPRAVQPTYDRTPQNLVTAGKLSDGAVLDGAAFKFAAAQGGPYSPDIPTGIDAGDYRVWYKVEDTENYSGVAETEIGASGLAGEKVLIKPKPITPKIDLAEPSYVYDKSKKNPQITVRDDQTVIPDNQYTVTWDKNDLRDVGTYTAVIENVANGNYVFRETAVVEIVAAAQDGLSITGKPGVVYYGDEITTLTATGGTDDGTVTWSITAGSSCADIDPATGILTAKDVGTITVEAKREVPNYGTVKAACNITIEPKPVTAVLTGVDRTYAANDRSADVRAEVNPSDLVNGSDEINIPNLAGVFDDENVGTNKRITITSPAPTVSGSHSDKYVVTYPATATADITPKSVTNPLTIELSGNDLRSSGGIDYYEFDGSEKRPTVTVKDGSEVIPSSNYTVDYSNNKNVGTGAKVTVTAKADGNYTFAPAEKTFEIRNVGAVLTSTPQAKDLTFTGQPQDLVTVGTATGGTVWYSSDGVNYGPAIPQRTDADTYTVYYKVKGDTNHTDTTPSQVHVTIKPKEITPTITLDSYSYVYDGSEKRPAVTVKDGNVTIGKTNGVDEFTVSYLDNVNAGLAAAVVSNANGGNYIVNGRASFTITKADIGPGGMTAPTGNPGLEYDGTAQELITRGGSPYGKMVYSLDGMNFSEAVPTGTAVKSYTVSYKVLGDSNHNDTAPAALPAVEIEKNTVTNPIIKLSPEKFTYNGIQQRPNVEVRDNKNRLISESEYVAAFTGNDGDDEMVKVGTYTVTITAADTSNYVFQGTVIAAFEITAADQETLSITGRRDQVYYGDVIQLGTTGGTGNGTVAWTITGNTDSTLSSSGLLTVRDINVPITVTATRSAGSDYKDISATWVFSAGAKPVTAVLTGVDRDYNANDTSVTVKAEVNPSDLVNGDEIVIPDLTGSFDDANVGTAKRISITGPAPTVSGKNSDKYVITYPATATASIRPADAAVVVEPEPIDGLTYDAARALKLVSAGSVTGGFMVYSLDGVTYSQIIPTAQNAGTYTVYYKAKGDNNHNDSQVGTKQVTIGERTVTAPQIELKPSSVQYDGDAKRPAAITVRDDQHHVIPEGEYRVIYAPDTEWKEKGSYTVIIEDNLTGDNSGGNYKISRAEAAFTITESAQNPLTIGNQPGLVYYGDSFTLSAAGGSGDGEITWESSAGGIAEIDANGLVTIKGTGAVTITATKAAAAGYSASEAKYLFNALPKRITAIVTADDKPYDTTTDATIHVSWEKGDLVGTDRIGTGDLRGTFEDALVGTNKTVNITGSATDDETSRKYAITIPQTATASIFKAEATVPPVTQSSGLVPYNGTPQILVSGGTLDTLYAETRDGVYTSTVPTGTNAGTYDVWYKVQGSATHNESAPQSLRVTIAPKELNNPTIHLPSDTFPYDGSEKRPTVTVMDGSTVIPSSEYTVNYTDNVDIGTAAVTIIDNDGGNYIVSGTKSFEIVAAGQNPLTIVTDKSANVYYGDAFKLSATGGSGSGAIQWGIDDASTPNAAAIGSDGTVTVTGVGTFTVTAYRAADGGYDKSNTDTVSFEAKPKPVTPVVTAEDRNYNGSKTVKLTAAWKDGDLVGTDEITVQVTGEAATADAGTNKQVTITSKNISADMGDVGNYSISYPTDIRVSIYKVEAKLENAPSANNREWDGTEEDLVSAGTTVDGIGTVEYSLSEKGGYSTTIPTAVDAGTYTVWYRVAESINYTGIGPVSVEVTIAEAGPALGDETGDNNSDNNSGNGGETGEGEAGSGGTGGGTGSTSSSTGTSHASAASGSSAVSAPMQTSVQNGTARAVMSTAGGSRLVAEAVANQSKNVVVKPEITGDVTKTEVSIPASTVSQLKSRTSADLTVSTPVASVTIPNAALDTLSSAGGTVSVAAEQVDNAVAVTLTAGGRPVESVPEGLTLTVPVEDAGPGTVAVLVRDDGTRETVRKAVPENGELSIPLDGSATVEIVDNSKKFTDVSATDWEADAVAFASAHELFNGTSETTFSPDEPMSRAMLTTVLYNLEGRPAQDSTSEFSDVSGDAWYADGVSWATENGITNGFSDSQFGPDEGVTREQFAVMLWRYAGSPAADGRALSFTDADQASDYAMEALCWATANGILNGHDDGRLDPGGLTTRAQAAQMLKNFMENT